MSLAAAAEPDRGPGGACCTCPAICVVVLTEAECAASGGVFQPGGTCNPNTCPGIPANDDCASALTITGVPTDYGGLVTLDVEGTNICATDDGPPLLPEFTTCSDSLIGGGEMHSDVWFYYESEGCGELTISTCNDADFDLMVAFYELRNADRPITTFFELGCEYANCEGPDGRSVLRGFLGGNIGDPFLIRVGGWNNEVPGGFDGNPQGSFTLHMSIENTIRSGSQGASRDGEPCYQFWSPVAAPPPYEFPKNRYLSFAVASPYGLIPDVRVTMTSTEIAGVTDIPSVWWADQPDENCISQVTRARPYPPPDVSACPIIHLTGCGITPTSTYEIVTTVFNSTSFPLVMQTQAKPGGKWWGDAVGFFDGTAWTAAQGAVNIDDAVAAIKTWQNPNGSRATHFTVTDIVPQVPNGVVNFNDVLFFLLAFQGEPYPFGCANDLCQDNMANPCP